MTKRKETRRARFCGSCGKLTMHTASSKHMKQRHYCKEKIGSIMINPYYKHVSICDECGRETTFRDMRAYDVEQLYKRIENSDKMRADLVKIVEKMEKNERTYITKIQELKERNRLLQDRLERARAKAIEYHDDILTLLNV